MTTTSLFDYGQAELGLSLGASALILSMSFFIGHMAWRSQTDCDGTAMR